MDNCIQQPLTYSQIQAICDNRVFPEQEVYSLHWVGGTSGSFIGTLMSFYLWPTRRPAELSKNNNSHNGTNFALFNWDKLSYFFLPTGHVSWLPPRHRYLRARDPNQPLLIFDHHPADWQYLWQRWPRARVIVISYRTCDAAEMNFNMYWKFFVENCNFDPEGWWLTQKRTDAQIFEKYNHPGEISQDDLASYLGKDNLIGKIPDLNAGTFWGIEGTAPEKYRDLVWRLPYWKITRDPEWVLQRMSQFLSKPTPDSAIEFYDRYIQGQNALIAKHAPWLREPGPWNQQIND